jgi:hypothetical protein
VEYDLFMARRFNMQKIVRSFYPSFQKCAATVCVFLLSLAGGARAETVAYWRFQDAAPGVVATNLASEVNTEVLTGKAKNTAGAARNPAHVADVPGTNIFSGIFGGTLLNSNNTASLYFTNAAAFPAQTNSQSGGYVEVTNVTSLLCPTNFTIEFFVKIARDVDWPLLIGKSRENGGASWGIDLDRSNPIKLRMDTQPLGQPGTTNGFNQNLVGPNIQDGKWHHVAVTYDTPTKKATFYIDYITQWNMTTTHEVTYTNFSLFIGKGAGSNQAFDGWMDEIRISDTVLKPSQFLSTATVPVDAQLYWQFDDAAIVPSTATSLVCEVGSPVMNGTAKLAGGGSVIPAFSTAVPLTNTRKITQGYRGAVVNASNSSSLLFVNTGLPTNTNSPAGGQVSASGFQSPSNFTAEAFIKVNRHVNYALIIGKVRIADNPSWSMEVEAGGTLRCRLDTYPESWNLAAHTYGENAAVGCNQTFGSGVSVEDGRWHHVALSYETATKNVKLYLDYVLKVSTATINPIVYTTGDILIGNGAGELAFDGWIDEVRITPRLLGTNEFLRTVLPPGTLLNVF